MPVENWSENVVVARVGTEPQFSETMQGLEQVLSGRAVDAVVDFEGVRVLNSSNIGALIRIRKQMVQMGRRLVLCGLGTEAWGVFLVTGLDKIFDFSNDVTTSLATLQMSRK
jgi:anti-anti-sigma factor